MVSLKTESHVLSPEDDSFALPSSFVRSFCQSATVLPRTASSRALGVRGWHSLALGLAAPRLGEVPEPLPLHTASSSRAQVLWLGSRWHGSLPRGSVTALVGDEDEVHIRWKEQHVQRPQTVPLLFPGVDASPEFMQLHS